MRGQVEIIGTAFPKTRLMIIVITLISVIAITLFLIKVLGDAYKSSYSEPTNE